MEKQEKIKKPATFLQGLSVLISLFLFVGVGYTVFGITVHACLIFATLFVMFIAFYNGYEWEELQAAIVDKISKAMPALLILITVGSVIGSWIYSGTVPMLIYYGLQIINPEMFLVVAFLIVAIVSTVTGTSWGSAGTAGVALMGVALGIGVPPAQAAGAIVAGAVFGDKMSPLSDTTNMASAMTDTNIYDHIRHMLWTTVPPSIVACIIWYIIGMQGEGYQTNTMESVTELMLTLGGIYKFNIILLIPAVIVLGGAILKKPVVPTMILGSLAAVFLGAFYQGFNLVDGFNSMVHGFKLTMVTDYDTANAPKVISTLLVRGGLLGMMNMVLIVICAMCFGGVADHCGFLTVVLKKCEDYMNSTAQIVSITSLTTILLISVCGLASVTAVLVGELFTDTYKRKGLDTRNLSRTIEDSGTQIISVLPWSGSGAYYLTTLGVSAWDYAVWAIPCYLGVFFALFYAITGISIKYRDYGYGINVKAKQKV